MANTNSNKNVPPKQGKYVFACGTPKEHCQGNNRAMNNGIRTINVHGTTEDAFNCHKRYLLKTGYTQVDSRGFASPDNGPILVLTKKSRYGAKLRNGKQATRNMPLNARGGIIIG